MRNTVRDNTLSFDKKYQKKKKTKQLYSSCHFKRGYQSKLVSYSCHICESQHHAEGHKSAVAETNKRVEYFQVALQTGFCQVPQIACLNKHVKHFKLGRLRLEYNWLNNCRKWHTGVSALRISSTKGSNIALSIVLLSCSIRESKYR